MEFVAGVFGQLQGTLLRGYGRAATVYWFAIVGAGLAALVWSIHDLFLEPADLPLAVVLSAIAGLSARFSIRVGRSSIFLSVGETVSYVALFALGPSAAVACAASEAFVGGLFVTRRWSGRLYSCACHAVVMTVVGTSAWAMVGEVDFWVAAGLPMVLLFAAAVALVYAALDTVLFRGILALRRCERTSPLKR